MGAESIDFIIDHEATSTEIKKAFDEQVESDLIRYGNDAYNGSFTTIDSVKFINKTFDTLDEAYRYCLDTAQKWEYAVAVYFMEKGKKKTLVAGWGAC